MTRRKRLLACAAGAALLAATPVTSRAGALLNENFESHPNPDSSTTTFANWTESVGTTAILAAVPLSGSASARLVAGTGR